MNSLTFLATASGRPGSQAVQDIFPLAIALVGLTIAGGVVIYVARRMLKSDAPSPGSGFTLQELRDLHKAGEITDEEFQSARESMIGRLKADKEAESPSESAGNAPQISQ